MSKINFTLNFFVYMDSTALLLSRHRKTRTTPETSTPTSPACRPSSPRWAARRWTWSTRTSSAGFPSSTTSLPPNRRRRKMSALSRRKLCRLHATRCPPTWPKPPTCETVLWRHKRTEASGWTKSWIRLPENWHYH